MIHSYLIKNRVNRRLPVDEWHQRLAFVPACTATKTLQATAQMVMTVEAKTRDHPRLHLKSRPPMFRCRRLNEEADMDMGFVDIPSVRGCTCFQLFMGIDSQTTRVHPLRSEHMNHTSLQDSCRELGSPAAIESDNAKSETSAKWNATCWQQCIAQLASEAENQ